MPAMEAFRGSNTPISVADLHALVGLAHTARGAPPEELPGSVLSASLGLCVVHRPDLADPDAPRGVLIGPGPEDGSWLVGRPACAPGQVTATFRASTSALVLDMRDIDCRRRLCRVLASIAYLEGRPFCLDMAWRGERPGPGLVDIRMTLTDLSRMYPPDGALVLVGLANALLGRCAMVDIAVVVVHRGAGAMELH